MAHEKHPEEILNPDGAMENAKALLQVVNHLDADIDKGQTEPLLFHGLIITIPHCWGSQPNSRSKPCICAKWPPPRSSTT